MQMVKVSSSNIADCGWENDTLYLTFHNGAVYSYTEVPESVYQQLLVAESVGKFFHAEIRPKFTATKVTEAAVPQP